jgi:hypothetical protein
MSTRVEQWMRDLRLAKAQAYELVVALNAAVLRAIPGAVAEIKYGGLLYSVGAGAAPICGVFAYSHHVSLEFSQGAELDDGQGHLQGAGKFRRHIKLQGLDEIPHKRVEHYLREAARKAGRSDSED